MCAGKTKHNLKLRIAEYKDAIRNGRMDYAMPDITRRKTTSLKFIGNEEVRPNPRRGHLINQLLRREPFGIYEVNTVEPYRLNETRDLSYFSVTKKYQFSSVSAGNESH